MPDEATWLAIERSYCDSNETLASIGTRFGVAVSTIHKRATRCGWPRRRAHPARSARLSGSVETAREAVARQLYWRLSHRLEQLELGPAAGGEPPADDDPEDRMLTTLIRQFEKLTGLDGISARERGRDPGRERQPSGRDSSTAREQQQSPPLDAERIRNEIAERLECLQAERDRQRGSR